MDLADGQGGDSSDFLDFKAFSSRWEWKWIEVIKFRDDLLLVAQQNGSFDSPKAAPSAQNPQIWPQQRGREGTKGKIRVGNARPRTTGAELGMGLFLNLLSRRPWQSQGKQEGAGGGFVQPQNLAKMMEWCKIKERVKKSPFLRASPLPENLAVSNP